MYKLGTVDCSRAVPAASCLLISSTHVTHQTSHIRRLNCNPVFESIYEQYRRCRILI
eukprot:COSAG02_NODE_5019_length_4721_cov_3.253942_3_plen_57_part_00